MKIAKSNYSFYTTVDISKEAYEEIKASLQHSVERHLSIDKEGREVLIFGSTAFRSKS